MNITGETAQLIEYIVSSLAVVFLVMLLLDSAASVIIDAISSKGGENVD